MAIQIIPEKLQATGAFDFGKILENKPIGMPHEGGPTKPYSNLFYWAHAWSDKGGLIGEHPHQAFEIMSFVLEGTIEHYDNQLGSWKSLNKGDAQIIRAGNGISHAEKFLKGAHIFQIWFDPDIRSALQRPASYDDYQASTFPEVQENGFTKRIYKGDGSPLEMYTEGLEIYQYTLEAGHHRIDLEGDKISAFYVIEGQVTINGEVAEANSFIQVKDENVLEVVTEEKTVLFNINAKKEVTYPTYAQMQGLTAD